MIAVSQVPSALCSSSAATVSSSTIETLASRQSSYARRRRRSTVHRDLVAKLREAVALLGYGAIWRRQPCAAPTASRRVADLVFEDVSSAVPRGRAAWRSSPARGVLTPVGSTDEDGVRERELAEAFVRGASRA
jgi:hypothetical protein